MISFVCLFIVGCHTARIQSDENFFTNDSPIIKTPITTTLQVKRGGDITLNCSNYEWQDDNITWQFKHCRKNQKRTHCHNKYNLDYREGQWKKLQYRIQRKTIELQNVTEDKGGLYRCLHKDESIVQFFMLDIKKQPSYEEYLPKILSVTFSNTSESLNTSIMLQCKFGSIVPPDVRWFKVCNASRCDPSRQLHFNGSCYCALSEDSNYAFPQRKRLFISKLKLYKSGTLSSGTYVCFVSNAYGIDYQSITVDMDDFEFEDTSSLSDLFLIPIIFVILPLKLWLIFHHCNRKKKARRRLIIPEMETPAECSLVISE